jgi:lipopolysaccharide export system permease protein
MRILTRYLLRAHMGPFLFSLTLMTGLLLVNAVAKRFEELAGKGLDPAVIGEVMLLSIPHVVALTLPMSVLVAVLFAFSSLAAENEISALKASGVNLTRIIAPVILAGAVFTGVMIWFNDRVLPETNHRLAALLVDIARKSPTLELKQQTINEIRATDYASRFFLQAARIDPATSRLTDVVIYDLSAPGRHRTIYADSGRMAFNNDQTDLFLTLYDGWVNEVTDAEPQSFQRVFYREQIVRMADVGNQLDRTTEMGYRGDREMSIAMLAAAVDEHRQHLAGVRREAAERASTALAEVNGGEAPAWPAATPVAVLRERVATALGAEVEDGFIIQAGNDHAGDIARRVGIELATLESQEALYQRQVNRYRVEYHKKYAIPVACIIFVILGAPLAVRFPRGGVGMVIAASMTIFMIYYTGLIGGESLADKGYISPVLAMWLPNGVFLAFGIWGMARVGREVATTRGGGWDDLGYALRSFLTSPLRRSAA